jgi:hypothetical protein
VSKLAPFISQRAHSLLSSFPRVSLNSLAKALTSSTRHPTILCVSKYRINTAYLALSWRMLSNAFRAPKSNQYSDDPLGLSMQTIQDMEMRTREHQSYQSLRTYARDTLIKPKIYYWTLEPKSSSQKQCVCEIIARESSVDISMEVSSKSNDERER